MKIYKLQPFFSEKIWGGQDLTKYGFQIPENKNIGEAWIISGHDNGMSYINDSEDVNNKKSLKDFFEQNREKFGNYQGVYPLLVKIITPKDALSVQVHPNDEYANRHHNGQLGKPESWYVIDCPKDAHIIYGHSAKTRTEIEEKIRKGEWDQFLTKFPINKGDFVYVEPGKIHAITSNVVVYELQRSSDITYRLYDYDRRDSNNNLRELHIKDALENINVPDTDGYYVANSNKKIFNSQYFSLYKLNAKEESEWICEENPYWLQLTVIEGKGTINNQYFQKGESAIGVEDIEKLIVTGNLEILVSWIRK